MGLYDAQQWFCTVEGLVVNGTTYNTGDEVDPADLAAERKRDVLINKRMVQPWNDTYGRRTDVGGFGLNTSLLLRHPTPHHMSARMMSDIGGTLGG